MKSAYCIFLFLNFSSYLYANWIFQSLYFDIKSSLYAADAYLIKNGKKKITYLDKKIKAAVKKHVIMLHYKVLTYQNHQDALCVVIKDQHDSSVEYELYLDSQSATTLNADRARSKKVFNIAVPKDAANFDGSYARAVLKQNDQILSYVQQPYTESDSVFDVIVHQSSKGFTLQMVTPEA